MKNLMSMVVTVFAALFVIGALGIGSLGCDNPKDQDRTSQDDKITPAQQQAVDRYMQQEGRPGFRSSDPSWSDRASYRYHQAADAVHSGAVTFGRFVAMVVFHVLMLLIPLLVISLIPGFAAGKFEMSIEGAILVAAGVVLLMANWIGVLNLQFWVWACLIVPGGALFVVSFFAKEGAWKILLVMGPPVLMVLLGLLRIVDAYMSALVTGSLLAIVGGVVAVYYIAEGDEKEHAHG